MVCVVKTLPELRGLDRLLEAHVRRASDLADSFEGHERGVSLVHVADRGRDAHRRQGLHAADAQQDLLADAQLAVAAVEAAGDHAVAAGVGGDVGVQQVQLDPADGDAPDLRLDGAARILDADRQRPAAGLSHQLDRHVERIVLGVGLLLPAVEVQVLAEVALLIHQADADDRDAEVRGALEMIAREDAQAARVDRQALVQTELGAEVGDGRLRIGAADLLEPGRRLQVLFAALPRRAAARGENSHSATGPRAWTAKPCRAASPDCGRTPPTGPDRSV